MSPLWFQFQWYDCLRNRDEVHEVISQWFGMKQTRKDHMIGTDYFHRHLVFAVIQLDDLTNRLRSEALGSRSLLSPNTALRDVLRSVSGKVDVSLSLSLDLRPLECLDLEVHRCSSSDRMN